MVKITSLCTDCVQVITNPLCPYCFSRQVLTWIRDKNLPAYKVRKMGRYLKKLVAEAEETPSDIMCITCDSKRVNLCTHCFTNKALRMIEKNSNEKVTEDFIEDFSTVIWRI
jgi:hypothetical protein